MSMEVDKPWIMYYYIGGSCAANYYTKLSRNVIKRLSDSSPVRRFTILVVSKGQRDQ